VAGNMAALVRDNLVVKQYLACVHGKFSLEKIEVNQPIKSAVKGRGINCVAPDGKQSRTLFQGIIYNEACNLSLVICRLYTGRTHQIRVHLQWLGYSIVNDPLYNNEKVDKLKNFFDMINIQRFQENEVTIQTVSNQDSVTENQSTPNAPNEIEIECLDCKAHFEDPKPDELYQYLHAYSYTSTDWSFKTELPSWITQIFPSITPQHIPDLSNNSNTENS